MQGRSWKQASIAKSIMNSRRRFLVDLGKVAALVALTSVPFEIFAKKETLKLTELHANDVYSHVKPFPENDPKYAGRSGVARKAAIIKEIRRSEENVLLLDAGDIFHGTSYFNKYDGSLELRLISKMGYDTATIGNHDFDYGMDVLNAQLHHAKIPFISANYDFSETVLSGKTISYKIFEKGGLRIGVFGLGFEWQGPVNPKLFGNTPDLAVKAAESDKVLAEESKNIDVFIGGYTYYRYRNREGKEALVAQTGWAGLDLGRIDFFYEKKNRKMSATGRTVEISKMSSVI